MSALRSRRGLGRRAAAFLAAVALTAGLGAVPAASGRVDPDRRCYSVNVVKRKTSLGVHQWTIEQWNLWCAECRRGHWKIVSVRRDTEFETGTNWRFVSRDGGTDRTGGGFAGSWTRFHFRLRYPHFEQNYYPRITVTMTASGQFAKSVRTGC